MLFWLVLIPKNPQQDDYWLGFGIASKNKTVFFAWLYKPQPPPKGAVRLYSTFISNTFQKGAFGLVLMYLKTKTDPKFGILSQVSSPLPVGSVSL